MKPVYSYMIVCLAGPKLAGCIWDGVIQYRTINTLGPIWSEHRRDAKIFAQAEAQAEMSDLNNSINSDYYLLLIQLPIGITHLRFVGLEDTPQGATEPTKLRAIEL